MSHLSLLQVPLCPKGWESRCCLPTTACAGLAKSAGSSLLLCRGGHRGPESGRIKRRCVSRGVCVAEGCSGLAGDLQCDCTSAALPSSGRIPPAVHISPGSEDPSSGSAEQGIWWWWLHYTHFWAFCYSQLPPVSFLGVQSRWCSPDLTLLWTEMQRYTHMNVAVLPLG